MPSSSDVPTAAGGGEQSPPLLEARARDAPPPAVGVGEEGRMREGERVLDALRHAPAAIAVVRGPSHVYEMANKRYLRVVGLRDLIGRPGREALPELESQGIWDLCDRAFASGEPWVEREKVIAVPRGLGGALEEGVFDFMLQPLRNALGVVDGLLIHGVEVTEAVHARQMLEQARRAAEEANRAKDQFLAVLAHELRNPLAPISTALQVIRRRPDAASSNECAIIERQLTQLTRLVEDLSDVSRIGSGKILLRRERVELCEVVERAIEAVSPAMGERQHHLSVHVPRNGLCVVCDRSRLIQVATNLLTNAAKYTQPRGRIEVRAHRDGEVVELRVRDSGIGISHEMLPRVFDLFAQESHAIQHSSGGLGLGLSIVKNLVTLHGGWVEARSEGVGCGSEFIVRLPCSTQHAGGRTLTAQHAGAESRPGRPGAFAELASLTALHPNLGQNLGQT